MGAVNKDAEKVWNRRAIVRKGRHLRWRNIKKAYKRMGVSTIDSLLKIIRNYFVEG